MIYPRSFANRTSNFRFAIACILFSSISAFGRVGVAETLVTIDANSRETAKPSFRFDRVHSVSNHDAGNIATVRIVGGRPDQSSGKVSALNDGLMPSNEDDPKANFFFAGGSRGRVLFDFGKPIELREINSYSWHSSQRAPQVYTLYTAVSADAEKQTTGTVEQLTAAGWRELANVDTRQKTPADSSQIAVSIHDSEAKSLGQMQYVLLVMEPTVADRRSAQTFFSEIDFVDDQDYPITVSQPTPLIDVLQINDQYTLTFDTTEMPELRSWVQEKLMPTCEQWYPKIVEMLPSENYQAPKKFKIVFERDMRGVAYTSGKDIHCAGKWYLGQLEGEGLGSVVHELVHVVQQYRGNTPGWLTEGVADQIRWHQYEPIPRAINLQRANYDDAYNASAAFLNYIKEKYDPTVIERLNAVLRQGRYRDDLWQDWYQKTPQEIWAEYVASEQTK